MENLWMSRLSRKEQAVRLVRDALGCACPAEVFDHYQVRYCESGIGPLVQMIMGERLLVWIVGMSRLGEPEKEVTEMLLKGLEERETRGLNRFRLVLVGNAPSDIRKRLAELPGRMGPNVHLHFISPETLSD